ncbi:MAG: hypothetical protein AVDCRST_MAG78-458, partial [uncultured Rubrobacteraceae bacterium]
GRRQDEDEGAIRHVRAARKVRGRHRLRRGGL